MDRFDANNPSDTVAIPNTAGTEDSSSGHNRDRMPVPEELEQRKQVEPESRLPAETLSSGFPPLKRLAGF
jgi:hypothetical protein